jgi:hypothetical protein
MNVPHLRPSGAVGTLSAGTADRRAREAGRVALMALIPALLALAITVEVPVANAPLVLAALVGVVAVVVLMLSTRLEVTVTILALYLGMLDGPVKLSVGVREATGAIPNILILAVSLGALLRLLARRERIRLPPLSGWIIAFVASVVIEAFNPKTAGLLKVLGGFRQQLQWVPFFVFGYVLIRSKVRLRQVFVIFGVMALANGVVATYQTGLSPSQLASWGPGYSALVTPEEGAKKGAARVYGSEGEARVRPPGLGSDSGFGGGVGVIALPACLALLAIWPPRRRWIAVVLCLGALLGVITGLGRLAVVGSGVGVVAFLAFAALGGQRISRALGATLVIAAVAIPVGAVFVSAVRSGTFKRYESLESSEAVSTVPTHKSSAWTKIPSLLAKAPFGVGLGTVGAAGGFGGRVTELVEGHSVSAETQYNFEADEVGLPGLLVWVTLSVYVIVFVARRMRRIGDGELAIALAAVFAPFVALTLEGFSGPFLTSAAAGPYFFFAIGIAAYWFAGPGRHALAARSEAT